LGGEEQYVEITSESSANPILVFIHGGPAWPQTPQLRHYSSELVSKYALVIWERRGAGKSYGKNPNPSNLTLEQIVADGHELTSCLKKEYDQEKVFIAGYSWGSLI
jgi:pimeloyl-ACP methyl ester carboxylesterase